MVFHDIVTTLNAILQLKPIRVCHRLIGIFKMLGD
jgi:hypothetical protein